MLTPAPSSICLSSSTQGRFALINASSSWSDFDIKYWIVMICLRRAIRRFQILLDLHNNCLIVSTPIPGWGCSLYTRASLRSRQIWNPRTGQNLSQLQFSLTGLKWNMHNTHRWNFARTSWRGRSLLKQLQRFYSWQIGTPSMLSSRSPNNKQNSSKLNHFERKET